MERLFQSIKTEWIPTLGCHSLMDVAKDAGSYLMDYYNRRRPHTFNDGISPVVAEEKLNILSGMS